jgi:hypothetical protein
MLTFQLAVDCDEDIKRLLCVSQQGGVFASAPTDLAHSSNHMAWKCGFDPRIDAFI